MLISKQLVYPCFEDPEELNLKRKAQLSSGKPPIYDRKSLNLTDKEIEEKIKDSQEKIKQIKAEGSSGGGLVKVILNGNSEIEKIDISEKIFSEDKTMLEDLIVAAHNEAKKNLKTKTTEEITKATGNFGIPGFKWPF